MTTRLLQSACLLALLVALGGCGHDSGEDDDAVAVPIAEAGASQPARVSIRTAQSAAIDSKESYRAGRMTIADAAGNPLYDGALEIRGRGNTTWNMPKKPYRVKLGDGAALLDMPASRHWVLLANYADKTLMRNDVAFALSRMIGMEYTPRSQFVELTVNGSYDGVYQLVEQIRIAPERVDVPELDVGDTAPDVISGGYLIEVDQRRGEDYCFDAPRSSMVMCLSSPEDLGKAAWTPQRDYLTGYVQALEDALFGPAFKDPVLGYAAYLDVDSAISYYLVNELLKNVDGNLQVSTYLYKKRNGRLTFGPVWDFDIALGNVNYGGGDQTAGWQNRSAPWFRRLFEDPAFDNRVRDRWARLKADGALAALQAHIDERARQLDIVQVRNFSRWNILNVYVWPNRVVTGSYAGEVAAMKEWLRQRIEWMDAQLAVR